MEVKAITKFARMSPKKIRPLAVVLRGLPAAAAGTQLKYHRSKSAKLLLQVVRSAMANAKNNYNLKEDNLKIKRLTVDAGPTQKRYWMRSRGSSDRLLKRTAHLSVVLSEIKPTLTKKPVAKPTVSVPAQPTDTTSVSSEPTAPTGQAELKPFQDKGKPSGVRRGLGRIFTPRTTNK